MKLAKYDAPCKAAGWGFLAMSSGTWGGMGPEGARVLHRLAKGAASWKEGDLRGSSPERARVLHRLAKRAASWQEGELRALRQNELLETVGLALMRQIWKLLANKNHLFR